MPTSNRTSYNTPFFPVYANYIQCNYPVDWYLMKLYVSIISALASSALTIWGWFICQYYIEPYILWCYTIKSLHSCIKDVFY